MKVIESTLVYIERGEHYLMLHRVKKKNDIHEGKWNGLGGKLELRESPEDCAVREVEEESGLRVNALHFAGHITFPEFDGTNDWSVFIFRADDFDGEIGDCDEGNLKWIPKSEVLSLNLWEGDRLFLPYVLASKPFFGKIRYEGGQVAEHKLVEIS